MKQRLSMTAAMLLCLATIGIAVYLGANHHENCSVCKFSAESPHDINESLTIAPLKKLMVSSDLK